jgi:hypothetical protein
MAKRRRRLSSGGLHGSPNEHARKEARIKARLARVLNDIQLIAERIPCATRLRQLTVAHRLIAAGKAHATYVPEIIKGLHRDLANAEIRLKGYQKRFRQVCLPGRSARGLNG